MQQVAGELLLVQWLLRAPRRPLLLVLLRPSLLQLLELRLLLQVVLVWIPLALGGLMPTLLTRVELLGLLLPLSLPLSLPPLLLPPAPLLLPLLLLPLLLLLLPLPLSLSLSLHLPPRLRQLHHPHR